jgi:hypothetical protein
MNIGFSIHRYGEFTMLMLGEAIFSLVVVLTEIDNPRYYATFFGALLTIILFQYLHFQSQPHDHEQYAMRRNKDAGLMWSLCNQLYALALVLLGSSYSFFLTDFTPPTTYSDTTTTETTASVDTTNSTESTAHRWLASASISGDDRHFDQARYIFSVSLALAFACLDIMTLLNVGWHNGKDRCICKRTHTVNYRGIAVVAVRVGWWAVTATLSVWIDEPTSLAWAGVTCVLMELLLRKCGCWFLEGGTVGVVDSRQKAVSHDHIKEEEADNDEEAEWPNVTHAEAESSK